MAEPGPALEKQFPAVAAWVREWLPKVSNHTGVWSAFLKWSELPDVLAKRSIQSGLMPYVGLTDKEKVNGLFNAKTPNVIFISRRLAEVFSAKPKDSSRIILLESTVLHELVHWGNFINRYALDARETHSKTKPDGKKVGGYVKHKKSLHEVGKLFEKEAYGLDINIKNRKSGARINCGTCCD